MAIKAFVVKVFGIFFISLPVFADAQFNEFSAKMQLQEKELRSQFVPVRNDDFQFSLVRPLFGVSPIEMYSSERKCFQTVVVIETRGGKITYAYKDISQVKQIPCAKLPFE